MSLTQGVNFFAPISTICDVALLNESRHAMLAKCNTTAPTTDDTFAVGCLMIRTDTGTLYQNTGTVANPVWTINGTGASGFSGYSGATGSSGISGYSGYSGYSGISGFSGAP